MATRPKAQEMAVACAMAAARTIPSSGEPTWPRVPHWLRPVEAPSGTLWCPEPGSIRPSAAAAVTAEGLRKGDQGLVASMTPVSPPVSQNACQPPHRIARAAR